MQRMIETFKRYKIQAVILLIIVLSIPLTLIQLSRQQEIRSRASTFPAISFALNPASSTQELGTQFNVAVNINTDTNDVNYVEITINYDTSKLTLVSFTPSTTLTTMINDSQSIGSVHYVGINSPANPPITGASVNIGSLKFQGKATGTGNVTFSNIQTFARGSNGIPLPVANTSTGSYTITTSAGNGTITGYVYSDVGDGVTSGLAGNGQKDPGEPGVSNATVNIAGQSTTTGSDGSYRFSGLALNTFTVSVTMPTNFVKSPGDTISKPVALTTSSPNGTANFGLSPSKNPPCYIIDPKATQLGISPGTRGYGDVIGVNESDTDGDGKVSLYDALYVLRYVAQIPPVLNSIQMEAANVRGLTTAANAVDALFILRYLAGLPIVGAAPNSFPVCTGQATITPAPSTSASCPNGNLVFDNKSSSFLALAGQHTLTWPHVVGAGSNRILVVSVNLRTSSGGLISSVKYNGISLTRIGEETYATGVHMSNSIWYLLNPPSGEYNISVVADRSITIGAGATSWSNVNQSSPIGTAITNMAVNGSPTITGNGSVCGVVVDNLATNTTCSFSPNSGQTEQWNRSVPGDDLSDHAGYGQTAGSSMPSAENVTMGWRGTGGNGCSGNWILKAIPLIADGTNPLPTVTPTPTVTPMPDCNGGGSCLACVSDQSNTCDGRGKQSCTYTLYNGDPRCNTVTSQVQCNIAPPNCLSGYTCNANKVCVVNPTVTPTLTPIPTQGVTPGVTNVATATPTPGQNGTTQIALNIGLDGIWSSGDNTNPDPKDSTKNPKRPTRNVTVELFNSSEALVSTFTGSIVYNSTSGIFTGTVALGQTPSGNYIVKVRSLGYLRKRLPGITSLTAGQAYNSIRINLTSGDLNGDNRIDLADYNILDDCVFFHTNPSGACSQNSDYATISDLTDNGVKDILDYGLLVREFAHEGD